MTLKDRILEALERDKQEMQAIEEAAASGVHPDAAASIVVGGEFRLSEDVKAALIPEPPVCVKLKRSILP